MRGIDIRTDAGLCGLLASDPGDLRSLLPHLGSGFRRVGCHRRKPFHALSSIVVPAQPNIDTEGQFENAHSLAEPLIAMPPYVAIMLYWQPYQPARHCDGLSQLARRRSPAAVRATRARQSKSSVVDAVLAELAQSITKTQHK